MFKVFKTFETIKAQLPDLPDLPALPSAIEEPWQQMEQQLQELRQPAKRLTQSLGVAGLLALSACSRAVDNVPTAPLLAPSTESRGASAAFREALPDIMLGIEGVRQELTRIRFEGTGPAPMRAAPPAPADVTTPALADDLPAPPADVAASKTATPASSAAAPTQAALPDGQAEFEKILNKIGSSPFAQAHIEKTEAGIENGKVGKVDLKMYMKRPNTVKLEIVKSTAGDSAGAKILYTSGQGDKAKVRPGGGLSFITTDLPKDDDRLTSNNFFAFDDLDLIGVHKRLSQGYSAKLVGKTRLNGTPIHVLRVTPDSGTHSLHAKITHEMVGYEPDTYTLRLWEMYAEGDKQPFFRMKIKEISFPNSIPDAQFKL